MTIPVVLLKSLQQFSGETDPASAHEQKTQLSTTLKGEGWRTETAPGTAGPGAEGGIAMATSTASHQDLLQS